VDSGSDEESEDAEGERAAESGGGKEEVDFHLR
jgi:hypothetical protein